MFLQLQRLVTIHSDYLHTRELSLQLRDILISLDTLIIPSRSEIHNSEGWLLLFQVLIQVIHFDEGLHSGDDVFVGGREESVEGEQGSC